MDKFLNEIVKILRRSYLFFIKINKKMITFLKKKNKKQLFFYFLGTAVLLVIGAGLFLLYLIKTLPSVEQIKAREMSQSTKIFDRSGTVLLYEISAGEKRTVISEDKVPQSLKDAILSIEDEKFYEEPAFDWKSIVRAFFVNLRSGEVVQGGSTITQQLAKNAFLSAEQTLLRKVKELILAVRINQYYSKDKILWLYINEVPFGPSTYGAESASLSYFGKSANALSLPESAVLAAILKAPSYYYPGGNHVPELLKRKDLVLRKMKDLGKISEKDFDSAVKEKIKFIPLISGIKAPHFVMTVQDYLINKYGEELIRKGGLQITTTLDWNLQQLAEKVVKDGALNNEKLYKGKNAALVAENATSGQILALVGSRDYFEIDNDGNFNVATQGLRQPGSSLKPFVYLTAFEKGLTPDTVLFDVPTEFSANNSICPPVPNYKDENTKCFHPENFDHLFVGPVNMRNALAQSINIPAVKSLYIAGLSNTIKKANSFGFKTLTDPSEYGLSLVLGGGAVHLIDSVGAYSALANDGEKVEQSYILEIKDSKNNVLEKYTPKVSRATDPQYAREINNILSDVSARAPLFQNSLNLTVFPGHDVALKTGTSNDYRDAWALGYTPDIAVGVWAGNNDNSKMQRSGSSLLAAIPIWNAFMSEALKTAEPKTFIKPDYRTPEKPILRGEYVVGGQIHNILYYIDKNNPLGNVPSNPQEDSQFVNWETGVLSWVNQNIQELQKQFSSAGFGQIEIQINNPQNNSFTSGEIFLNVSIKSFTNLSEVRVYFNDTMIYNAGLPREKAYNFIWSFFPVQTNQQNTLSVEVLDETGKTNKSSLVIYKQN